MDGLNFSLLPQVMTLKGIQELAELLQTHLDLLTFSVKSASGVMPPGGDGGSNGCYIITVVFAARVAVIQSWE